MYLGSTLMAAGIALASASPWAALAGAVYFLAFYPSAIRGEAAFLATRFPETFAPWAREVPAFVPRLTPGGPRTSRFAWTRVAVNREWRTLLAVPLALVVLLGARPLPPTVLRMAAIDWRSRRPPSRGDRCPTRSIAATS